MAGLLVQTVACPPIEFFHHMRRISWSFGRDQLIWQLSHTLIYINKENDQTCLSSSKHLPNIHCTDIKQALEKNKNDPNICTSTKYWINVGTNFPLPRKQWLPSPWFIAFYTVVLSSLLKTLYCVKKGLKIISFYISILPWP